MKNNWIITIALVLAASCSADYGDYKGADYDALPSEYRADVVVTIKQDTDGTVFFQAGRERLYPGDNYPFSGQCRAMGSVTVYAEEVPLYGHRVDVNWMEPLDKGSFKLYPGTATGEDGIDVLASSWITSVEDGYLTIHYKTWWGESAAHHDFVLVQEEDPYELTIHHSANGDGKDIYSEGIVYFDINQLPPARPSVGVAPQRVKINWKTTDGKPASAEFDFETRT